MAPTTSTPARRLGLRAAFLLSLAAVWSLLGASPAAAHGIGADAADLSVLGFVPLGIEHMLLGWDHIAFIGGVVLLAGEWRRTAEEVHSGDWAIAGNPLSTADVKALAAGVGV
jgi:hypothetical protein